MGTTPTNRLGLTLDDGSEFINPGNNDFQRIDDVMPAIIVNDGVVPADSALYDGALVAEKTSGKVWMAVKNVGGTFDHQWIKYPYTYCAYITSLPFANGAYTQWGWNTFDAVRSVNASSSQTQAGTNAWVCPVKGVYDVMVHAQFATNGVGSRGVILYINGATDGSSTEMVIPACGIAGFTTNVATSMRRVLAAGDVISAVFYQNSGGVLNIYTNIAAVMISPVV